MNDNKTALLNGQSTTDYNVTFHSSALDATNGTNALNPSFLSTGQIIYARVQNNSDSVCFSVSNFELILKPVPAVSKLPSIIVCSAYILPAIANGSYYTAANGGGSNIPVGTAITQTQTIYIYNQTGDATSCPAASNFKVTVIDQNLITFPSASHCGKYQLPVLAYGEFYTEPNGAGTVLDQGSFITSTQTIYVHYQTTIAPICEINTSFTITILPLPALAEVQNVFDCSSFTLPALSHGNYYTAAEGGGIELAAGTQITTTQEIFVYAVNTGSPLCSSSNQFTVYIGDIQPADLNQCEPYQLPQLPIGRYFTGPNGSGQEILAGTIINTSQTIYIFVEDTTQLCATNVEFHLTISQPQIDTFVDVSACGEYQLPALTNGSYFTATDGGGTVLH